MKKTKRIDEIRKEGFEALRNSLNPVELARFLQSLGVGSGNYTGERKNWLPQDMDEIKKGLKERETNE